MTLYTTAYRFFRWTYLPPRLLRYTAYLWIHTRLPQAGVNQSLDSVCGDIDTTMLVTEIAGCVRGVDINLTNNGNLNSSELTRIIRVR